MAETRLEDEVGVIVMGTTIEVRSSNLNSEIEIGNNDDDEEYDEELANIEWVDSSNYRTRLYNYIPCYSDSITDYEYNDYISEAFTEIAEDRGEPDDLNFEDLDNYLSSRGERLGDYSSVESLAQYAADEAIVDSFWGDKTDILKYYAICYYQSQHGHMIPQELLDEIDNDNYYRSIDKLGEVEDIIDEWWDDHDGIENYAP